MITRTNEAWFFMNHVQVHRPSFLNVISSRGGQERLFAVYSGDDNLISVLLLVGRHSKWVLR